MWAGGGLGGHHNRGSGKGLVWNNICKVGIIIDNLSISFSNSFVKHICKGDDTLFWQDKWIGIYTLKEKFGRLYNLDRNKNALVMDRCSRGENGDLCFEWDWLRVPNGRSESELQQMGNDLRSFVFLDGPRDNWKFMLQNDGSYSVAFMSRLIDERLLASHNIFLPTDRLRMLPQKIGVLIWRVKQNRIPVRVELDKRGIDLDSVCCPICDDGLETVEHIFIHCAFARDLWSRVFRWWNLNKQPYAHMGELFQGIIDINNPQKEVALLEGHRVGLWLYDLEKLKPYLIPKKER
ncbi:uncharacterized protein [Rutidosis leptorrhynchoides]|uniref:uncharacterized protein n=1 Tax=Rutidosis leptorrhynchoides TaxID=125765 RepID=UPI003A9A2506